MTAEAASAPDLLPLLLVGAGLAVAAFLVAVAGAAAWLHRRRDPEPDAPRPRAAVERRDDPILAAMGLGEDRATREGDDQKGRR